MVHNNENYTSILAQGLEIKYPLTKLSLKSFDKSFPVSYCLIYPVS